MELVLDICSTGLIIAILLALYRLVKGPTVLDRILCFDAIVVCVVGLIVVLSIDWDTSFFLELIMVVSLLGFISGVALVVYLEKTMDVEAPPKSHWEETRRRPGLGNEEGNGKGGGA